MKTSTLVRSVAALIALAASTPVLAHTGAAGHDHGLIDGFMHPISGLDHLLAMIAVGMLAANLGGRALWLVPTTFVFMMAAGAALGVSQIGLPFAEAGIAVSVIMLGALIAMRLPLQTATAMAIVAVFAVFHGYAHGSEVPVDASTAQFAGGFMLATALLHLAGIAIGLGLAEKAGHVSTPRSSKLIGSAMSITGTGLLAGWL